MMTKNVERVSYVWGTFHLADLVRIGGAQQLDGVDVELLIRRQGFLAQPLHPLACLGEMLFQHLPRRGEHLHAYDPETSILEALNDSSNDTSHETVGLDQHKRTLAHLGTSQFFGVQLKLLFFVLSATCRSES